MFNRNNTSLSFLRKKAYADLIFSEVIENYGCVTKTKDKERINQFLIYLYENYAKDITLQSCAEKFHYAKNSFSHLFSKYVGMDFRLFLNNIRAEKAYSLLHSPENKDRTVLEIALQCGFQSEATFYRAYKRCHLVSPRR